MLAHHSSLYLMTQQTTQNYSNPRRYVPMYHFFLLGLASVTLIAAFVNFCFSVGKADWFPALIILAISLSLGLACWYLRAFAIAAQNRAIRAEENLRYFAVTGKLLPKELKMSQIVAIRFAPDEEFLELVQKAVSGNLGNDAIKKEIKNWKADHHRA